jgi:hypothetical protein
VSGVTSGNGSTPQGGAAPARVPQAETGLARVSLPWPRPARPKLPALAAYRVQRLLAPNVLYRRLAAWLVAFRLPYRLFTHTEKAAKSAIFGCRMCGQCTLPVTGYACPMSCPKQLRNGPCGGVGADGSCEVYPATRCVWVVAYERAESHGRAGDLRLLQRPLDHRQWGQSSWVNYWRGHDDGLWTADDGLAAPPPARRPETAVRS